MIKTTNKKLGKKTLLLWKEERDKVAKSYDLVEFKKFFRKYQAIGVYAPMALPSDEVLEITMRKMVYQMKSATAEEKEEAKKWLTDRGYTVEIDDNPPRFKGMRGKI